MYILYLILALVILLLMVTIHEFGHYTAGKLLGFKINEFSIGFGKALYSKKKKSGEIFSIRLVPLGGYCAFEGEEEDSENPQAFMKQKPWKRLIVLFSGAFFNFISAIIFSVILLCAVGYDIPKVNSINPVVKIEQSENVENMLLLDDVITSVNNVNISENLNASNLATYLAGNLSTFESEDGKYTANVVYTRDNVSNSITINFVVNTNNILKENDVIYAVNGTKISFVSDNLFSTLISKNSSNDKVTLLVKRDGKNIDVECSYLEYGIPYTTYKNKQTNEVISYKNYNKLTDEQKENYENNGLTYAKAIGVSSSAYQFSFGEALLNAVPYTFGFAFKVLQSLGMLITGQLGLSAVGGPITTITTMATFTQTNFSTFFVLLPLIAANLAVFNWLPFPALDGSKMLFTIIEMIRRKPINQKVENMIHTVGLIILFALVIIADVYHLFIG